MSNPNEPNVGPRIRAIRERAGLSLRGLAEKCGLSVNAISRIERGENSPTVTSLHQLASALNVSITEFFQDAPEQITVHVQKDNRMVYNRNGMAMASLGIGLRNQQLEPFEVTLQPGEVSAEDSVTHPGQEFAFCLSGKLDYEVGGTVYHLEAGDSLLFEATQPHVFRNVSYAPTSVMLVFQVERGSHLARDQHIGE